VQLSPSTICGGSDFFGLGGLSLFLEFEEGCWADAGVLWQWRSARK